MWWKCAKEYERSPPRAAWTYAPRCLNDGVAVRQGCSSPQAVHMTRAPLGSSSASSRIPLACSLKASPCARAVPQAKSATAVKPAPRRARARAAAGQGRAPAKATKATGGIRSHRPQVFMKTCGQRRAAQMATAATLARARRPDSWVTRVGAEDAPEQVLEPLAERTPGSLERLFRDIRCAGDRPDRRPDEAGREPAGNQGEPGKSAGRRQGCDAPEQQQQQQGKRVGRDRE